jgi:hypothetical protein
MPSRVRSGLAQGRRRSLDREATTVRTIRTMANLLQGRMHGRRDHRARMRGSSIEPLEGRSLPSSVASILSDPIDVPDGIRGAAEIDSSSSHLKHTSSKKTASSSPDDSGHVDRTSNGSDPSSSSSIRSDVTTGGAIRRPTDQNVGLRDPVDLLQADGRRNELWPVGDSDDAESQDMSELANGALDSVSVTSTVGWTQGASAPVFTSLFNLSDRIGGLDDRAVAGPASSPATASQPGSVADIALNLGPTEATMVPEGLLEALSSLQVSAALTNRELEAPASAELLNGALHSDWETVDRELRQFLARLDGLADTPVGHGAWTAWLVWTGAATALILARNYSDGRRLFLRRPVPMLIGARVRQPVPVGPWPLGPP